MVTLKEVVPYGRSMREYIDMFALTEVDLQRRILGCGDGPASFNAEATAEGRRVISIDPLYRFSADEIRSRCSEVIDDIIGQVRRVPETYVWDFHVSPDHLRALRCETVEKFARDFEPGKRAGRYIVGELPHLPFADGQFELALCSHLLFTYSDHLAREFHVASALELCRVAGEVRIFPLITLSHERSPHLAPVCEALRAASISCEIISVAYELQRGGNQLLRLSRST
jgi:hypothetical protein